MSPLIIGIIAGSLTTISFIPQIIKIYRTKNAKDLSLITFIVFSAGVSLWLLYGILIRELPVILANSVSLAFLAVIVALKIKYR